MAHAHWPHRHGSPAPGFRIDDDDGEGEAAQLLATATAASASATTASATATSTSLGDPSLQVPRARSPTATRPRRATDAKPEPEPEPEPEPDLPRDTKQVRNARSETRRPLTMADSLRPEARAPLLKDGRAAPALSWGRSGYAPVANHDALDVDDANADDGADAVADATRDASPLFFTAMLSSLHDWLHRARGIRHIPRAPTTATASSGWTGHDATSLDDADTTLPHWAYTDEAAAKYAQQRRRRALQAVAVIAVTLAALAGVLATAQWAWLNRATASATNDASGSAPPPRLRTLLVSLDGFRPEYLSRGLTPTLAALARDGVQSEAMHPAFPSTGLTPAQHGIVSNTFHDPLVQKDFNYTNPADNADPSWWGGEPIWITAERQGRVAAVQSWPGSEAPHNGTRASLWTHYHKWEVEQRVELSADMPLVRPDLIALYIPDVDQVGHQYGPDSIQLNQTLVRVDRALASLAAFLYARDLWETTNVVVVSDHGMTLADDPVPDPVWPPPPRTSEDADPPLHHILARLRATEIKYHYRTYLKHEVPEHLHYRDNPRIPPIVAIPESGYQFEAWPNESLPQGMHGYDQVDNPDMQAIFLARGPFFAPAVARLESNTVPPLANTELYAMLCKMLAVEPAPNVAQGIDWLDLTDGPAKAA
ncbi:hypothetical protein AMAG_10333 [Allomyces macrogynus ATCC 38327]|uniref:Type I phosphodiesterase/nucleotide pyrophosphatase n=1 Tax=Allomyces macrogynus (strain ATCC 38327) TaxID=578462 RepID=A0A0L0SUL2_ALLM3|nr:hypothetical protein AMAG_10333 [Allomyces macrogynus ATCC 38327]|eukprot:KNE66070.1 hypothetical protein AMAG_10333 [Allomyces macrogynus ATCC 38327]